MITRRYWYIPAILLLVLAGMICLGGCFQVEPPTPPPDSPPETPANNLPVIHYISAQQQVTPLSSSEIRCVVTDADDDDLSYSWSADSGTIDGEGNTVTWNAPEEEGSYSIATTVSDGNGGEVSDSVLIAVVTRPNHAPSLSLIVKPEGKPEVTITPDTVMGMEEIRVPRNDTAEIECIAEDPDGDEIRYTWAATEGRVTGEGAKVLYLASKTGKQAVTVTAIDSRGAKAQLSVYFDIPCCGAQ